ncbi:signal peptidase I [Aneurinibacillus uraniidurans]|uniref:signal peptidase I n=1 Tax=Aneurinibacillus uraniidurans TaxID=2966586 RepID=UPI00234A179B|nr:signal peptidase I [Aneurinibacillus sp. B1]WCN39348.1 signal peptidase I [Aneurinibacillus sp. B1]
MKILAIILMLIFSLVACESTFTSTSNGMAPFLQDGEKFVVDKNYYQDHPVTRGDVILFKVEDTKKYVKRVISLPGETIEYKNDILYINNNPIDEPYLAEYKLEAKQDKTLQITGDFGPYTIPQGEVFVLGDNRRNSLDSRFLGSIKMEHIIGKVVRKISSNQ